LWDIREKMFRNYEFVRSRWNVSLCTDVRRRTLKQKRKVVKFLFHS